MSEMLLECISREVKESNVFSIMVVETKDNSKVEHVSVVLRYYFHFYPAESLNAKSFLQYMKNTLSRWGINITNCIAQT